VKISRKDVLGTEDLPLWCEEIPTPLSSSKSRLRCGILERDNKATGSCPYVENVAYTRAARLILGAGSSGLGIKWCHGFPVIL